MRIVGASLRPPGIPFWGFCGPLLFVLFPTPPPVSPGRQP